MSSPTPSLNSEAALRDAIDDLHLCDDDGFACEYATDEGKGYKRTYCKRREDSVQVILHLIRQQKLALLAEAEGKLQVEKEAAQSNLEYQEQPKEIQT